MAAPTRDDARLMVQLAQWGTLWSRVGPAALRAREKYGEPRLYENFEALAKG